MNFSDAAYYVAQANHVPELKRSLTRWRIATVVATCGQLAIIALLL